MLTTVLSFVATGRDIMWTLGFLVVGKFPRVVRKAWKVFVTIFGYWIDIRVSAISFRGYMCCREAYMNSICGEPSVAM